MRIGIITSITLHPIRAPAGVPSFSWQSGDGIHQPEQLGDVIAIGGSEHHRQWHSFGLNDNVVLAATFAPIHRAGTGPAPSVRGPNRGAVHNSSPPVDLALARQFAEQFHQQPFPDSGALPSPEAAQTGVS
jgi:hypothetical protein